MIRSLRCDETLVDELVQNRMLDGQLDECDLTIAELAKVKASFVKTLLSMMHSRIKYQKATETPTTSFNVNKDGAITSALDSRTTAIQSAYTTSLNIEGHEKKKRPMRKPPASAA
jgi:flagellar hook-basal body complex protein FliE